MPKFDLDKLREMAQPPKEHRPRMTPDEMARKKKEIRERLKNTSKKDLVSSK